MNLAKTSSIGIADDLAILLVEDNPGDARLVQTYLSKIDPELFDAGLELDIAESLSEGLGVLEKSSVDVLLLDLGLPESRGVETLERLVEKGPQVPIIVLTGLHDKALAYDAIKKGADDFLHKDRLDEHRLAHALRYALDRSRREWELKLKTRAIESAELAIGLVAVEAEDVKVVYLNEACQKILGYTDGELDRAGWSALQRDRGPEEPFFDARRVRSMTTGEVVEERICRKDGSTFWCKITASPVESDGGRGAFTHVLYTFEDITEKRKARSYLAQFDRMATLGLLSAGVAHEINNPLSYAIANMQYVERSLKAGVADRESIDLESLLDATEDALDGAKRISRVVNNLRDLSGRDETNKGQFCYLRLRRPLQAALTIARNRIQQRAELVTDLEADPQLYSDESKLSQVFLNLLINAAQAIPRDSDKCHEVRVETDTRPGEVVVTIRDTGVGISEEHLERIFEPFFSTKNPEEGTGLGLAISRRLVDHLGGRIEVESTVGEGTTVTVFLPTADMADTAEASAD
ncbi:MAG: ATP-binding protein [Persicimonas sp.]